MTAQDIIQHLEEVQHGIDENQAIKEISASELEQISGARRDGALGFTWSKILHK